MSTRAVLAPIFLALILIPQGTSRASAPSAPAFRLRLDPGHPWRPLFGLERVGRPLRILVETPQPPARGRHVLVATYKGKEVGTHDLRLPPAPPYSVAIEIGEFADEVFLIREDGSGGTPVELTRQPIRSSAIVPEAIARPDTVVNPVDLGAILVPNGWLLLGPGQSSLLRIAAISRDRDKASAVVRAWFASAPGNVGTVAIPLSRGIVERRRLTFPRPRTSTDRDTLHVSLGSAAGGELWHKAIRVMLVSDPPRWPRFGAGLTKLRYDAPISVLDPKTGALSSLRYEDGWDPKLRDVVVSLPNGSRFVFWRGSSYIPFWAGQHNTGASYEWAEMLSRPKDAVDCVEPLMDKELRYGRVEIIESTAARVHVRWKYQSTDLRYQVWGDEAIEDYYFYPDAFGTRVLTLKTAPDAEYELSEFILLTHQGTYPLDVLPENLVDALALDGGKISFTPCHSSVMSWTAARPEPLCTSRHAAVDALGRSRDMTVRRWAWLIGMTDADDNSLVRWARGDSRPPSLELHGAGLCLDAYAPERRALRLQVHGPSITIRLRPEPVCVNPVFELEGAPKGKLAVMHDGRALPPEAFAWDGHVLWLDATIREPMSLNLRFASAE